MEERGGSIRTMAIGLRARVLWSTSASPALWLGGALLLVALQQVVLQAVGPVGAVDAALHEYYERHPEEFRRRLAVASEDPVLRPVIAEIQAGGIQAVMRHYNDEALLQRLSQRMGGVPEEAWAAAGMPLHEAARAGLVAAVTAALASPKDPTVDAADVERGMSALAYAAAYGHVEVAERLLAARADPRGTDRQGNTILHFAAGYGRGKVCALLAQHLEPKDASHRNAAGQTPMDVARGNGHDAHDLLRNLLAAT